MVQKHVFRDPKGSTQPCKSINLYCISNKTRRQSVYAERDPATVAIVSFPWVFLWSVSVCCVSQQGRLLLETSVKRVCVSFYVRINTANDHTFICSCGCLICARNFCAEFIYSEFLFCIYFPCIYLLIVMPLTKLTNFVLWLERSLRLCQGGECLGVENSIYKSHAFYYSPSGIAEG